MAVSVAGWALVVGAFSFAVGLAVGFYRWAIAAERARQEEMFAIEINDSTELWKGLRVHNAAQCNPVGPCPVHRPSDHHMRDWPVVWRSDRGMIERVCSHGVGHPDPDDLASRAARGRPCGGVHGCDGCCG